MCVIFVADQERPTPEMLELGKKANPHATGIAWREINPATGKVEVYWKKGNDIPLEETKKLAAELPLPYVIHFRNPSSGTGQKDGCAHPFPIDPKVPLWLSGHIRGYVLFHNGMWGRWRELILEAAMRSRLKLPIEAWSDSRGLAWMACHFGHGFLELVDEKTVAFGPKEIEVFGNKDWKRINGVLCSNDHWESKIVTTPYNANALGSHNRGHHGPHGAHHGSNHVPHRQRAGFTGNTHSTKGSDAQPNTPGSVTGGSPNLTPFRGAAAPSVLSQSAEGAPGVSEQEAVQSTHGRVTATHQRPQSEREAASQATWARGINAKNYRRGPATASELGYELQWCQGGCGKKVAFIEDQGKMYCYEDWMEKFGWAQDEDERNARLFLTNKCGFCLIRDAQNVTENSRKWICATCWHEHGKPDVKKILRSGDPQLDARKADSIRGITPAVVM